MAANDEFESFRDSIADLDDDRERRIRQQFEDSRADVVTPPRATADGHDPVVAEPVVVELVSDTTVAAPASRHRRPVFVGIAAAAVLVALISALALLRGSDSTTDVASGVDDLPLSEVARRALNQPDLDLQGEQALYQQKTTASGFPGNADLASGFTVQDTETWARRDGTGLERLTSRFIQRGPGQPLGVGSAAPIERPVTDPQSFLEVRDYNEIRALPTDPAALKTLVETSFVSGEDASTTVEFLSSLLALDITPPAVRAAGFEVIAQLGGEPIGEVTMPSGVTGAAYQGVGADGRSWVIVIDPVSTKVLAFAADVGTADRLFLDASRWREFGEEQMVDAVPN